MTALAAELARILEAEAGFPSLSPESLGRVLHALGWTPEPTIAEITATLEELQRDGWIEAVHSARIGRRFRIMRNRPGLDMSEANTTTTSVCASVAQGERHGRNLSD